MSCLKVICWALILILKLHFPPGVSIAAVLTMLCIKFSQILRNLQTFSNCVQIFLYTLYIFVCVDVIYSGEYRARILSRQLL